MSTQQTSSGGLGTVSVLTIVFITLKLVGTITWPWYWVLSPIWLSWGIVLFCLLCGALVYVVTK